MQLQDGDKAERIRHLNDLLRCQGIGGQVMITAGLDALGKEKVGRVLKEVAAFSAFGASNDPYSEHDCATLTVDEVEIIFKIDYYDRSLERHSPDAADPSVTSRVMTVMLADEY